ncbi:MAG: hypothetical protein QOF78_2085 [Phycisphaerales bacterium]|jgi:hypothetical protein|nr:hypothetical protein [Phycisphaerales bacterium]
MTQAEQKFDNNAATASVAGSATDEIVAEPDAGYRWKHLLVAAAMIAAGLWFAYDGWIKWPRENQRIHQVQKEKDTANAAGNTTEVEKLAKELQSLNFHTGMDLFFQKFLAFTLPGFGLLWGVWTLKDTRGVYRMSGNTLNAPGHPPVTIDDIRRIDKRKWDKKGVAYLHYEIGTPPKAGVLKLDDFAYERQPTDEILERIEKNVMPTVSTQVSSTTRA